MNQGQTEQFRELYEQTYNRAEYTAKRYLTDEQDVQDVLQDSYVKAFTKLNTLQDLAKKQSWINMIVANTAMDLLKKKRPSVFSDLTTEDEDDEPLEFEDESTEFQVEPNIDRKETARIVNEVLEQLDQKYRLVLFQRYGQELKISEIAELNGCSENTVKTRLSRAEKQLKAKKDEFRKRGIDLAAIPVVLLLKMAFFPETSYAAPSEEIFKNSLAEAEKAAEAQTAGIAGGTAASAVKTAGTAAAAAKAAGAGAAVKIIAAILAVGAIAGGAAIAGRRNSNTLPPETASTLSETTAPAVGNEVVLQDRVQSEAENQTEAAAPELDDTEKELLQKAIELASGEPLDFAQYYYDHQGDFMDLAKKYGRRSLFTAKELGIEGDALLFDSGEGALYVGPIEDELPDGQGIMTWVRQGIQYITGTWEKGALEGSVTEEIFDVTNEDGRIIITRFEGNMIHSAFDGAVTRTRNYSDFHSGEPFVFSFQYDHGTGTMDGFSIETEGKHQGEYVLRNGNFSFYTKDPVQHLNNYG